jgi:L-malate glycosyltransferase
LRILIIISNFYPVIGGSERQLFLLASELVNLGHKVEILTRKSSIGLIEKETVNGFTINRVNFINKNSLLAKLSFIFYGYKFIKKNQFDHVISSQIGVSTFLGALHKRHYGGKLLVRLTGRGTEQFKKNFFTKAKFNYITKMVDKFVALNDKMINDLIDLSIDKLRISKIDNGVLVNKKVEIEKNNYALFCGRIEKVKGLDFLLEAFKQIPSIDLVIVGDGKEKKRLMELYKDFHNIKWFDSTLYVEKYYLNAKILISSSLYEGISNTILEAMSHGIPVIATNVGGTTEIIKNGITGVLIPPKDTNAIIEAVNQLYNNNTFLDEISSKSYYFCKDNFGIEKKAIKYEGILRNPMKYEKSRALL